ncbi:unnamed protein product, partial [Pleuronectes platessa]
AGPEPQISTTAPDVSVTSVPGRTAAATALIKLRTGDVLQSAHQNVTRQTPLRSNGSSMAISGVIVLDVRALQREEVSVCLVTKVTEGCQIELRLAVVSVNGRRCRTELKCVTQNQAGRQEVCRFIWRDYVIKSEALFSDYKLSSITPSSSEDLETLYVLVWQMKLSQIDGDRL